MNYTEAIALAKTGKEEGFAYLYESTYQSKYYLALRYMKDEEAAKDVLQDAYIKAFAKIDTLDNPEAFASWLGMIVANTAKNALEKSNPLLFSDVTVDDDGESFEYQIEDENLSNQPEIAYTRKETQELVYELMDSLSEEQRLCILMFHIEGASISEIAATMNVSENTVKSRLNYGRKNLKARAEDLRKKGYKLYSIAPLPLLLWLLRTQKESMVTDGTIDAATKEVGDVVRNTVGNTVGNTAINGAANTLKTGFIHTVTGKVTIAVVGICMTGAAIFAGKQIFTQPKPVQTEATELLQNDDSNENTDVKTTLEDSEYSTYIAGGLTKEELQHVLAYGPEIMSEQGLTVKDYSMILNGLCQGTYGKETYVKDFGTDANYRHQYSVDDVNRLFYSFTDFQYGQGYNQNAITVDGTMIKFAPATLGSTITATITDTKYSKDEIDIYYTFVKDTYQKGTTTTNKKAILKPISDGTYRINIIEDVVAGQENKTEESKDKDTSTNGSAETVNSATIKEVYEKVLQSVQNKEAGYEFTAASSYTGEYKYFVKDINGDGILDLIVGATYTVDVFYASDIRVFTCKQSGNGYELINVSGEVAAITVSVAGDGNGLFNEEFSRGTGQTEVYRITITDNILTMNTTPEMQFIFGDSTAQAYNAANPLPEWKDISDLSGL